VPVQWCRSGVAKVERWRFDSIGDAPVAIGGGFRLGSDLKALFRESCGLAGPLRLDLLGRGEAEPLAFDRPFAVIGRDPAADLVLDDERVGRRHLYVQAIAGGVHWVNLRASARGDGGEAPAETGWLGGAAGVALGPFAIRAGQGGAVASLEDPLAARSLDDAPLPEVVLEFPSHPHRPPWRVSRVLTLVGRGHECRLRIIDPAISTIHLALLRTPAGLWAVDLLGRGGIAINGRQARWGKLEPGDRLAAGPLVLRVRQAPRALPGPARAEAPGARSLEGPRRDPRPLARAERPAAPTSATTTGPFPPAELFEPMMAELAERFDRMQERMFDRFEQAMMTMARMFGVLQREQMDMVREELNRLDRLNRTLETLQAELAARDPGAATLRLIPADPVPADVLARIEALAGPQAAADADAPAAPAPAPAAPGEGEGESRAAAIKAEPVVNPDARVGAGGAVDEEVHSLLVRRIAAIQRERQTRWQRVLGLVMGR
jgi:hypothetical protein